MGTHRVNAGYTLLLPLVPERVAAAEKLLGELEADHTRLPFAQSPTTHFATITVIPAQSYRDEPLPATLLFATSFCGPVRVHLAELVRVMGGALRELFAHCEGFDLECDDDDFEAWLIARRHGDTFYSGMQHLSPECVRRHQELRTAIQTHLDERPEPPAGTALEVRKQIQDFVDTRVDLAWAREPWRPSLGALLAFYWRSLLVEAGVAALLACTIGAAFVDSGILNAIVIAGWLAVAAFVILVLVMLVTIHDAEAEQTYVSSRPPDERARAQAATQTRPVINEFTLAGPIKAEGNLRPLFVRLSLWVIARVADGVPGIPYIGSGINIPTVATARWIAGDGGRRVMFISNYTNEGKGYVRDFIETPGGAKRINLSFGFGSGYPKTRWIVEGGAADDPNAYLYSLSDNQLPTLFWYGPYRDISIDNIKRAREIREGLYGRMSEDKAREWLRLL